MHCPDCGSDNIPGVDHCEQCGAPLIGLQGPESRVERSISRHTVGAIATRDPITLPSFTSVRACIAEMAAARVGCVLIEEGGQVVGIFTERDVLSRILANPASFDDLVSAHMTPSPQSISVDDSIAYALHLMSVGGYRHLPVADDTGRAVAVVSARDVLRFLAIRFAAIREPV